MRNTRRFGAALALLAFATQARANNASNIFYERTLMSVAGERCGLFSPSVGAALASSAKQARGAALRSGADAGDLRAAEERARGKGLIIGCKSSDLTVAAERVRSGFAGYARMYKMSFPGSLTSWQADRTKVATGVRWRLSQTAGSGVVFGLASDAGGLTAVTTAPQAGAASGARLVMRDPRLAPSAYLDPRQKTLAGRIAPRSVTTAFLASARAPAPLGLLPTGAVGGTAIRFPASAAAALDQLDPREAVTLELVYPSRNGDRVESVLFEVGDFAAGRAFLAAQP